MPPEVLGSCFPTVELCIQTQGVSLFAVKLSWLLLTVAILFYQVGRVVVGNGGAMIFRNGLSVPAPHGCEITALFGGEIGFVSYL